MIKAFLPALALAFLAAQLCIALDTPLPWMIGPLFSTAIACMLGARLGAPVQAREAGQWAIGTALIRVEEVRIGRTPVDNGIQLPLSTCMYLGDRWECLFKQGDANVRAYSKYRIDPGQYWLEMPAEKLWVF